MKKFILMSLCLLFVFGSSGAYGLPVVVPDFGSDPSGAQFTIAPIGAAEGASSNIAGPPELTFGVTSPDGTANTMQMTWDPIDEAEDAQAGWELVFGLDPDLTNQVISVSVNPPANAGGAGAITTIEIQVVDIAKKLVGGWGFNTDQTGPGGVAWPGAPPLGNDFVAAGKWVAGGPPVIASLACNWMQTVNINIGLGPVAGSATITGGPMGLLIGPNYLIAGAGGNLAQAAKLEFYENGNLRGSAGLPITNPNFQSNFWDHVSVTPEPATIMLLGLGGLLLRRRKR